MKPPAGDIWYRIVKVKRDEATRPPCAMRGWIQRAARRRWAGVYGGALRTYRSTARVARVSSRRTVRESCVSRPLTATARGNQLRSSREPGAV